MVSVMSVANLLALTNSVHLTPTEDRLNPFKDSLADLLVLINSSGDSLGVINIAYRSRIQYQIPDILHGKE